jgi:ferredoxin
VKVSARLPDWPSACKAGTCSTCRTRTRDIREAATEWGRLVPPRLLTVGDGGNWRFF